MGLINIQPTTQMSYVEPVLSTPQEMVTKKTPKKRTKKLAGDEVIPRVDDAPKPLIETDVPYITTYEETQNLLKNAISEIDQASKEVADDIQAIRDSKTMRSKYTYLSNLQAARGTLIGQKISAIREINSTITKSHELDAKRSKENKANKMDEGDDTARLQAMYDAFVSTPRGSFDGQYVNPLQVSTQDISLANPNAVVASLMGLNQGTGYDQFVNNMSEEAAIMFAEDNPNVEEVVMYNPNNGAMKFAYYDKLTHSEVTGIKPKDINMFADNLRFDFDTMHATSKDINGRYQIIMDDTLGTVASQQDMKVAEPVAEGDDSSMSGY